MSGVAIYMEGGGVSRDAKGDLRRGMETLLQPLKEAARAKVLHWKLVACGARNEAFRRFRNAVGNGDNAIVVLLVDAEDPVNGTPRQHLQSRDEWDMQFADEDTVHFMVQTMETWIVADLDALRTYYGQKFNGKVLPRAKNLEDVTKADVERKLKQATKRTKKGPYDKIKHARDLLKRIEVGKVKERCPHCKRLFNVLGRMIDSA